MHKFFFSPPHEGESVISNIGHRKYIGGHWEEIGRLQFDFLKKMGLKPNHCLLDIGCGSLRGSIYYIKYLNKNNYIGLDKESKLIELGIKNELDKKIFLKKDPTFLINDKFDFSEINNEPDFSIAQSLFTHLNPGDIRLCLKNLSEILTKNHSFFATFKKGNSFLNTKNSNSFSVFYYSIKTLNKIANEVGWKTEYVGDFGHPRNQEIMKFTYFFS